MAGDAEVLSETTRARLSRAVRDAYSSAAIEPRATHPFPVGRDFALSLGYPADLLDAIPGVAVDAFTGVSNLAVLADVARSARVLDLGCGAGLDSLIAGRRAGPSGRVIAVDFSAAMLERAHTAQAQARARNVLVCRGDAEHLPVRSATIDVALVNGIFNLNPGRATIFGELARVVRAGGAVFAAEIVLREPLPPTTQFSEADWFA